MSVNAAELIVATKAVGMSDVELSLAAISAAVIGVGVESVKMAADFQSSATLLVTSAGESRNNLKMVTDGMLAMSIETATSASTLETAMFTVESASYHGAAGLAVLKAAAEGAKVENADLTGVVEALTTTMHDWREPANQAIDVMNSFRESASIGKMRMDDFTGAMKNVGPVASLAAIHLTDVEAALSTMSLEGDKGAAAGTHLAQSLLNMISPSTKAMGVLKEIGLTAQQVSDDMKKSLPDTLALITDDIGKKFPAGSEAYNHALSDMFGGTRGLKAILELTGQNLKDFEKDASAIAPTMTANSKAVDGWADVQKNFNFQVGQAAEAINTLMIKLGTALLPVLSDLFQSVTPNLQAFGDWIDKSRILEGVTKTLTGWIGYIGDAFNRANTYVAPFKESIAKFTDSYGVALSKIEQTATAIAPLKDAFAQTLNNLDKLGNSVKPVTTGFGSFLNTLEQTGSAVAPLTDSFDRATSVLSKTHQIVGAQPNVWIPFWTEILHVKQQIMAINWGAVWQGIAKIGDAISKMDWGKVGAFFSNVATNIGKIDWGKFGKAFEGFAISLTKVDWGKVEEGFSKIGAALIGVDWNKMGEDLPKIIDGLSKVDWGSIGKAFSDTIQFTKDLVAAFKWAFGLLLGNSIIPDIVNGIVSWFKSLPGKAMGAISGFVTNIISWFQQLPGRLGAIVSNTVNIIVQWFQSLGPRAMGAINGFIGQVGAAFSGLLGRAYGWGSGLINNIISGIQGASGGIGNALHGLHIPGFASGIENFGGGLAYVHGGEVLTYLPRGTSVIPANQVGHSSGNSPSQASSNNADRPLILQIDGRTFARVILPALTDQIRYGVGSVGI